MWAFSDESEQAGVMLLGTVFIDPRYLAPARAHLRALLLPGQRQVHTRKEAPRRRRQLLDVARIEGVSAVVLRYRRPQGVTRPAGRHLLLQASAGPVVGSGVTAWTLDDQDPVQTADG